MRAESTLGWLMLQHLCGSVMRQQAEALPVTRMAVTIDAENRALARVELAKAMSEALNPHRVQLRASPGLHEHGVLGVMAGLGHGGAMAALNPNLEPPQP